MLKELSYRFFLYRMNELVFFSSLTHFFTLFSIKAVIKQDVAPAYAELNVCVWNCKQTQSLYVLHLKKVTSQGCICSAIFKNNHQQKLVAPFSFQSIAAFHLTATPPLLLLVNCIVLPLSVEERQGRRDKTAEWTDVITCLPKFPAMVMKTDNCQICGKNLQSL